MKKVLSAVVVAAALMFAGTAQAQFAFDLKLAYSIPSGNVVSTSSGSMGAAISDTWSGAFVLGVDARYRFTPNLSAGVYFQYNPAFITTSACPGGGCSGYDMRTGLEVVYGFIPDGGMNPWVSLGTGWQWTNGGDSTSSVTLSGWEYFNVQAGLDFSLMKMFALGPYVGYYGGSYTTLSASGGGTSGSETIPSGLRAFHGWFQFGVKGTLNI
jgi:hypothetical protein